MEKEKLKVESKIELNEHLEHNDTHCGNDDNINLFMIDPPRKDPCCNLKCVIF